MPKRKTVRRIDASEVQGEGAYVVVSGVKVREIRKIRQDVASGKGSEEALDEFDLGLDLVRSHVLEWNFVDDLGKPLPSPKEDPSVMEELTEEEATFLTNMLIGGDEEVKN